MTSITDEVTIEKVCNKCGISKPIEAYQKNWRCKYGVLGTCKLCRNSGFYKKKYENQKDDPHYRERKRRTSSAYLKAHPEVSKAHQLAKSIPLPDECERCGSKSKLHRHHPDHLKPLEIVALCIPCHEIAHHGEPI